MSFGGIINNTLLRMAPLLNFVPQTDEEKKVLQYFDKLAEAHGGIDFSQPRRISTKGETTFVTYVFNDGEAGELSNAPEGFSVSLLVNATDEVTENITTGENRNDCTLHHFKVVNNKASQDEIKLKCAKTKKI